MGLLFDSTGRGSNQSPAPQTWPTQPVVPDIDPGQNLMIGGDQLFIQTGSPGDNNRAYYNSMVGFNAGKQLTTGHHNTAIGALALPALTAGNANSGLGEGALFSTTSGNQNTGVGCNALEFNVTGSDNTAVGNAALAASLLDQNTAVGSAALLSATSAANTAVGYTAFQNLVNGASNTGIGRAAGYSIISGSNNVAVGVNAGNTDGTTATGSAVTNVTLLGFQAQATASNTIVLGSAIAANRTNLVFGQAGVAAAFGGGLGMFHIANAQTLPSSTPTGGGILYVTGGALHFRGSAGTDTVVAVA